MIALLLAAQVATSELGRPIYVQVEAPAAADVDLERSSTDYVYVTPKEKTAKGDKTVWVLEVTPLAVGKLEVPIYWKGEAQPTVLNLEVPDPKLPEDAQLNDIKRPARARPLIWPWLLALAAAVAAWYWWRNRKTARALVAAAGPPPDLRTPDQIALDELAKLEASPLWAEGRYKEFYFLLTETLRAYLERRYGFPALKLTTTELSRQLRRASIDANAVSSIKQLFESSDLVKFAKTLPQAGQGGLDIDTAKKIVAQTSSHDLAGTPS